MQHTAHTQNKKRQPKNQPAAYARKSASLSKKHDAISLLTEDHKNAKGLFKEFEKLREHKNSDNRKKELIQQICVELTIHAKVEEELLYPVAREIINDKKIKEITDQAYVEHAGAKELIQQLQSMRTGDDYSDAKVIVLQEYISHHIKEEEGKMFPALKKAKVDLEMLGEHIKQRKEELKNDMGEVSMSMYSKS